MKFLSQEEAKQLDLELFQDCKIETLIELAGLTIAQIIHSIDNSTKCLFLIGPSNNGADGLVASRYLKIFNPKRKIFLHAPKKTKFENQQNLCKQHGCEFVDSLLDFSNEKLIIVDCVFGFGFKTGKIKPPFDDQIDFLLKHSENQTIVSVDVPSGWDVETGPIVGVENFTPNVLISLTSPKLFAKDVQFERHFVGGRFIPPFIAEKYCLEGLEYKNSELYFELK